MKNQIIHFMFILCLLPSKGLCEGEKKEENPFKVLMDELNPVIQKYYPNAQSEHNQRELRLQAETMIFQIHRVGRDGSFQKETQEIEGPTHKGFTLIISNFRNRRYNGPLETPQVLTKPYWSTFVNEVKRNENYFWARFSFGSKTNSNFQKEMMDLLKNQKTNSARITSPQKESKTVVNGSEVTEKVNSY